jgi:GMP synthase (glutamine-hydrolysing)
MFGVQFHPEVSHSIHGMAILRNFAVNVCGSPCDWNMADIAEEFIRDVRH